MAANTVAPEEPSHDKTKFLRANLPRIAVTAIALVYLAFNYFNWAEPTVAQPWPEFHESLKRGSAADFIHTAGEHVDYYHHRDTDVAGFVELVDGFLEFLDSEFIPIAPGRRFVVFVSRNADVHQLNSRILFNKKKVAYFGTYYPGYDVLATHATTGPGTVTSLLVYPVMRQLVGGRPRWAEQAVATFFEKSFAFRRADGGLAFRVGFQNSWRVQEVRDVDPLSLAQIIAGQGTVRQSHYRMVAMFLWRHGLFKAFLERLRENDLNLRLNFVAAAFDLPMYQVEPLWRRYLTEVDKRRPVVDRVPVSQIFESEAEFRRVMGKYDEPTDSDEFAHLTGGRFGAALSYPGR